MQVQVDIGFDQLVKIIKALPSKDLQRLKAEIERQADDYSQQADLENLLLNGPIATQKQLDVIEKNRKAVNQWRTK